MNEPLVSVVLPTRNHAALLPHALESVRSQNYPNLEIVVIDDASTDETSSLLAAYAARDGRVQIIRNRENQGFVRSLNIGIREAKGEYIARIDDDDVWIDREKIGKQIKFLDSHPEYAVVGGGIIRVNGTGREISRELFPGTDENIRNAMLLTDPIVHVAAMFRKKDWEAVGEYDEMFDYSQDWELWAKLGRIGRYYNFQEYFVRSLFSSQGRSSRNMRHHLWLNLAVRKRYRNDFPHFWKGYVLGWISYLFSFLPIRYRVHPLLVRVKRFIVG